MKNYEVIIIGGGPAGVSTALYTARSGIKTCLIENGGGALLRAKHIQNHYGSGTVSGKELYARGLKQAEEVGVQIIRDEATFAQWDYGGITVTMPSGQAHGMRLVIATGIKRSESLIANAHGNNVSYCAVCDGFFYRNRVVGVVGAGEFAKHELSVLERTVSKAILFTNGQTPSFAAANVYTQKIERFDLNEIDNVRSVLLDDGTEVPVNGVFMAEGVCGGDTLAKSMGLITTERGEIVTDGQGKTNIPGVYAAGDCTAGEKQVAKAVYDGMTVGLAIVSSKKGKM